MLQASELSGVAVAVAMFAMGLAPLAGAAPASAAQPGSRASPAAAPVADSARTERSPAGAGSLERVQAEGFDPEAILPAVGAEVPQVWNGWYVNRSVDALRRAIEENKPLVLVIGEGWCGYCTRLVQNGLRCPAVDRFAGEAVFAVSFVSSDRGAAAIASSLNIEAYPTITVLEPESRMLLERGRINGYFDGAPLGDHLETILWKTRPRYYFEENGGSDNVDIGALGLWRSPSRPGSVATAVSGARSRGLKHAAPTPDCG